MFKIFNRKNEQEEEKPEVKINAKYIGGHSMYPVENETQVWFFADRLVVMNPRIIIPYGEITKLGGQQERRITATRVFFTGVIGLVSPETFRYTVIEYNDGFMDQTVVIDFRNNAENVQTGLYKNMIDAKDRANGVEPRYGDYEI